MDGHQASMLREYGDVVNRLDTLRTGRCALSASDRALFQSASSHLYRAIADVTGATTLIESSKSPGRLQALRSVPGLRVRAIHLIRDVVDVAASLKKEWKRDPESGIEVALRSRARVRTALAWRVHNAAAARVCSELKERACRLHFEDLVAAPADVVSRLAAFAELDLGSTCEDLRGGKPIDIGHTVGGNRLRLQKRIQLRSPAEQMPRSPVDWVTSKLGAGWTDLLDRSKGIGRDRGD